MSGRRRGPPQVRGLRGAGRPGLLFALLLCAPACKQPPPAQSGAIQLLTAFAGPSAAVARVEVELLTSKLAPLQPPYQTQLTAEDGRFGGLLAGVPAQALVISAVARSQGGQRLFAGEALVEVTAGATTLVLMTLQPDTPTEAGPLILAASADPQRVPFGGTVALSAAVTDQDPAQLPTLHLAWTASAGSFLTSTDRSGALWKAPPGPQSLVATLTLTATDAKGLSARASLQVIVGADAGTVTLVAQPNSWPRIDTLQTEEQWLQQGGVAHLHATAHDPDGDPVHYRWSSDDCAGSFSGPTDGATAAFQLAASAGADRCTVALAVDDGRGGETEGKLVLALAPAGTPLPPVIDQQLVSDPRVFDGSAALLSVVAHDPGAPGAPLDFAWSARNGVVTGVQGSGQQARASFQSAACSGDASATVTVTSARGGPSTSVSFALLNCAPSCRELGRKSSGLSSGVYRIAPTGTGDGSPPPLAVFCEMATDGGGWTFVAFHDATTAGARWFDLPLGDYQVSQAAAPTYSLGLLPALGATELLIALDVAAPAEAAARHGLLLLTHAAGLANFERGPLPCTTGQPFGYRLNFDSPYLYSARWRCGPGEWTAQDADGVDLLGFGGPGVLAGAALGGPPGHGHAAWIYAR